MERIFTYSITEDNAGKDIHAFLREKGYSRHILASMKPVPDAVLVNGTHQYMRYVLRPGDVLTTRVRDEAPSETIIPAPVPFSIVYEDQDILVIDKPANEAIHPAAGHPANTLGNGVAWYYRQQNIPFVFRCINRLDRDTTGLLIVAKNMVSASVLEQQLVRREIHRTYLAIADGKMPSEGVIDLPIARKPGSLIERCVDTENGDRAVTHFRTLRFYPAPDRTDFLFPAAPGGSDPECASGYSAVQLQLETGRTHQIRVHLTYTGHPILGDTLYNVHYRNIFGNYPAAGTAQETQQASVTSGRKLNNPKDPLSISRQALHSWKLDFIHPITERKLHFEAPVPDDMAALL